MTHENRRFTPFSFYMYHHLLHTCVLLLMVGITLPIIFINTKLNVADIRVNIRPVATHGLINIRFQQTKKLLKIIKYHRIMIKFDELIKKEEKILFMTTLH